MEIHLGHYLVKTELIEAPDEEIILNRHAQPIVTDVKENGLVNHEVEETKQYEIVGGYDWTPPQSEQLLQHQTNIINNVNWDLVCYICGSIFENRTFLVSHLRKHKINSCLICGKVFVKKQVLKRHFSMHQNNETLETSSNCNIELKPNQNTTWNQIPAVEQQTAPQNTIPIIPATPTTTTTFYNNCYICTEQFLTKTQLISHLRKHKVNSCLICGKVFVKKQVLKRHLLMHRNNNNNNGTLETYNKSNIELKLNKNTTRKPILAVEQQTAPRNTTPIPTTLTTSHNCYICTEQFVTKTQLISHLRKHKINNCSICGKVFNKKFVLKRHLLSHTKTGNGDAIEQVKHECSICGRDYRRKETLQRHMRSCARTFLDDIVVEDQSEKIRIEKGLEEFIKIAPYKEMQIKQEMIENNIII